VKSSPAAWAQARKESTDKQFYKEHIKQQGAGGIKNVLGDDNLNDSK